MFKFQRVFSFERRWVDYLYFEGNHLGSMGMDDDGMWIKTSRNLTLYEINLLIAQIAKSDANLLSNEIEFLKLN